MSTRINSQYKTSTSQIVRMLNDRELSFQQLSQVLHQDEEDLSKDLDHLVDNAVIARKFHNHHVTYTRAQHPFASIFQHTSK